MKKRSLVPSLLGENAATGSILHGDGVVGFFRTKID